MQLDTSRLLRWTVKNSNLRTFMQIKTESESNQWCNRINSNKIEESRGKNLLDSAEEHDPTTRRGSGNNPLDPAKSGAAAAAVRHEDPFMGLDFVFPLVKLLVL